MPNDFTLFNRILYHDLRPWLPQNRIEIRFAQLIGELEPAYPTFHLLYDIDFFRPFNFQTQYYFKLITREAIDYCNRIVDLITYDKNECLQRYWIDNTLNKSITTRLTDVGRLIKTKKYDLSQIDSRLVSFDTDTDHKTDTYIFQYLKVVIMKIYLEIQAMFLHLVKDPLIEVDLFTRWLCEPVPERSFLIEAPKVTDDAKQSVRRQKVQNDFNPRLNDFRAAKKGIAYYNDMIRNPRRFASMEEQLFQNEYIDPDYSFTDRHGAKNELAMITHVLIQKNYFNGFNDTTKRKIMPKDIKKFIIHRYMADIDKQFRNMGNNPDKIADFLDKQYWLSKLPVGGR